MLKRRANQAILLGVFLFALGFLVPAGAQAATYYVATTGNNSNPGTEAQPWLTIQKCADTINGGDTCIVKDGTYAGRTNISRSGSSGLPIKIVAENKHGATVSVSSAASCGGYSVTTPFCPSGSFIELDGFKISQLHSAGFYNAGVWLPGSNVAIRNFHMRVHGSGVQVGGSANTITGNYIHESDFGIYVGGSGHLVENNTVYAPKYNGASNDIDYIRFFGSGHTFRGNTLYGCDVARAVAERGAHVDCFQTWETSSGTLSNILIENNYCANAHTGFQMRSTVPTTMSSGIFVRNNIVVGAGLVPGYSIDHVAHTHGYKNMRFYNNHFFVGGFLRIDDGATGDVKNNIFYGCSSPNSPYYFAGGAVQISGTISSNNLIYTSGRTFSGYTNDIMNVAPTFENLAGGDYRLTSASRGVDEGYAISSSAWINPTDRAGISRPIGAWDIGAYEYGGTASPAAKKGDLNADNKVDVTDLGILLSQWGPSTGSGQVADVNLDGKVDVTDLGILLSNWG